MVREAIEIQKEPENFNREDGLRLPCPGLSRTWKPLINTCVKRKDPTVTSQLQTSPAPHKNTNDGITCSISSPQQGIGSTQGTPGNSRYNLRSRKPIWVPVLLSGLQCILLLLRVGITMLYTPEDAFGCGSETADFNPFVTKLFITIPPVEAYSPS